MKVNDPRFRLNKGGLRYLIAICAGGATLAFGASSVFAQELGLATVTGSRITRDTSVSSSRPLAEIGAEMLNNTSATDIAEILNDNPSLLSSVSSINSIDDDAADLENTDNVGAAPRSTCGALAMKGP